jgi:hypothetical protein
MKVSGAALLDLFDAPTVAPAAAPTRELLRTHWAEYARTCGHVVRTCVHLKRGLLAPESPGVVKRYRGGLCAACAAAIAKGRRR